MVFVLALALEFVATLVAFTQAQASGALDGDIGNFCDDDNTVQSDLTIQHCEQMDEEMVLVAENTTIETSFFLDWETVGCELEKGSSDEFWDLCRCEDEPSVDGECYWLSAVRPFVDGCFATPFFFFNQSLTWRDDVSSLGTCWPLNPDGTKTMVIVTTSISLASQLVEGVVGRAYFKNPNRGPRLMIAASAFEAAGVVVTFALLTQMKMFDDDYGQSEFFKFFHETNGYDQKALRSLAVSAAGFALVGILAEVCASCLLAKSNGVPRNHRCHYLSAFAGGAIWLGAALIEVVLTTFVVLASEGANHANVEEDVRWGVFQHALVSLVALEVLGLVALWVFKYLWARAKLLVHTEDFPRRGGLK